MNSNAKQRLLRAIASPIVFVLLTGGSASAQWVNIRLPGTPRTPDGKPNLTAPVPRTADGTPDLSGLWRNPQGGLANDLTSSGAQVSFTQEGAAIYKQRQETDSKGRPSENCLPHGIPDAMMVGVTPFKIVQHPGVVLILYEFQNRYRQLFTDGRGFPEDMMPAWLGYSIGKWENDTFVVETRGFNDRSWLDDGGHPHSDALHVTERFHRRDFGHMDFEITIDDPKMYTKPWTVSAHFELFADNELMEWVCENEKDAGHSAGK
jgi:hypothetical protein